jgi:transcriptional regulator with XRE-family HTH domain
MQHLLQARLVAIIARDKLGISQEQLEDRLGVLLVLVPALVDRVAAMSPELLAKLLGTPVDALADRLLTLKAGAAAHMTA